MLLEKILERIFGGKVHILVTVGTKPALEVILRENEIILDIKNPLLALEAGIEHVLSRKGGGEDYSKKLQALKEMGYKIKLRYKRFEIEL